MMNFDQAAHIIKHWKTSDIRLPSDFDWSTRKEGQTLSGVGSFHIRMPLLDLAIRSGYPLPDDRALWSQRIERFEGGWLTVAHIAVQRGNTFEFPFSHWNLKDSDGQPVIHALIRSRMTPPAHFSQWEIKNVRGLSAAHDYLYSLQKPMPASFDQWGLVNRLGYTVAHEAVRVAYDLGDDAIGALPPDRSIWLLERRDRDTGENDGNTVLHLRAELGGSIPDIFTLEDWHLRNPREKSVIDLARENGRAQLVAQYEALKIRSVMEQSTRGPASKSRISRGEP